MYHNLSTFDDFTIATIPKGKQQNIVARIDQTRKLSGLDIGGCGGVYGGVYGVVYVPPPPVVPPPAKYDSQGNVVLPILIMSDLLSRI